MRFLVSFLALAALAPIAGAQEMLFSIESDLPGMSAPWLEEEVLGIGAGAATRTMLPLEALRILSGDTDQDGILDDAPADVDALHVNAGGGIAAWLFSVTVNTSFADGTSVLDGDVFRFNGSGGIQVVHPESFFEAATGTAAVDVDGFAIGPAGELYFSFAEDEATTDPSLTLQNGGIAVLDEQTVFRLDPGSATAVIHLTQAQVAAVFSQALGLSLTTVVDVTGIAVDPTSPALDLLLVAGSTSQSIRGRVVSTRSGGQPFVLGGATVDPTLLALGAAPIIDALALNPAPSHPVMRALPGTGSSSAGGAGLLAIDGLQPGEPVQLVATDAVLPGPFAVATSAFSGFGVIFPDPSHPAWLVSLGPPAWQVTADLTGRAAYAFAFDGLPPGVQAVVQGIGITSFALTAPATVLVTP